MPPRTTSIRHFIFATSAVQSRDAGTTHAVDISWAGARMALTVLRDRSYYHLSRQGGVTTTDPQSGVRYDHQEQTRTAERLRPRLDWAGGRPGQRQDVGPAERASSTTMCGGVDMTQQQQQLVTCFQSSPCDPNSA